MFFFLSISRSVLLLSAVLNQMKHSSSLSAMFVYIRVSPNNLINARAPSSGPRLSLFSEVSYEAILSSLKPCIPGSGKVALHPDSVQIALSREQFNSCRPDFWFCLHCWFCSSCLPSVEHQRFTLARPLLNTFSTTSHTAGPSSSQTWLTTFLSHAFNAACLSFPPALQLGQYEAAK